MHDDTGDGLAEVIGRALTDSTFREALKADPDTALAPFNLAPKVVKTIRGIDPDLLEDQAKLLGGHTAITIAVKITKSF